MNQQDLKNLALDFYSDVKTLPQLISEIMTGEVSEKTKSLFKEETGLNVLFLNNVRNDKVIYSTINHDSTNGLSLKLAYQLSKLPKSSVEKIIYLTFSETLLNDWIVNDYLIPENYVFSEVTDENVSYIKNALILADIIREKYYKEKESINFE